MRSIRHVLRSRLWVHPRLAFRWLSEAVFVRARLDRLGHIGNNSMKIDEYKSDSPSLQTSANSTVSCLVSVTASNQATSFMAHSTERAKVLGKAVWSALLLHRNPYLVILRAGSLPASSTTHPHFRALTATDTSCHTSWAKSLNRQSMLGFKSSRFRLPCRNSTGSPTGRSSRIDSYAGAANCWC